jgi:gluconolactonase
MVVRPWFSICLCAAAAVSISFLQADEAPKAVETVEVKLKDLVLNLPKGWETSDTVNNMRLATYVIPAAEGDKDKGELAISTFGRDGGGVAANLERWVGQFDAEGREVTIKKGKAGENTDHIADISGIYQKSSGPPILRKTSPVKGYRMLGVIYQVKGKDVYFLKLTGPDATIKAQADALRATFGAKVEGEEDYEI